MLTIGAIAFLFPFYYMFIGSLQASPDTTIAGAFPNPANLTLNNYAQINSRINLVSGLVNSGIFTGGVLLGTIVFGVLAGYSLAILQWRGRGTTFALALLVQTIPFQLLMIPLYVLIARNYGLADNYLGMILPFAINSTAVLIFRQYFLQLPRELFDAARIDGAGEFTLLWRIALPLVRPALVDRAAADLHRPVERVPLAVPDHEGGEPAAARRLAGELHLDRLRLHHQPVRRDPRRRGRAGGARSWCCSSSSSATSPPATSARPSRAEQTRNHERRPHRTGGARRSARQLPRGAGAHQRAHRPHLDRPVLGAVSRASRLGDRAVRTRRRR